MSSASAATTSTRPGSTCRFAEAQSFFDREGAADEIEVMVADPDRVEELSPALAAAAGPRALLWTWRDASGAFLRRSTSSGG